MRADSGPAASPRGWLSRKCWAATEAGSDFRRAALAILCISPSVACAAAEAVATRPGVMNGAPLRAEGALETAAGLLLVLATILALAWAARRFGRFSNAGKGLVNVLGGISLGSRERVVIVQVEDTRLVLGVAPGRIETLYVLEATEDAQPSFAKALKTEIPESVQ